MTINEFRDFVLVADDVQHDSDGYLQSFVVRVFDSPVGQGEQKEQVTIPDTLHVHMRWLEERQLDEDIQRQMDFGELLAGLLLPAYARRLFGESFRRLRESEGLRLRLRLADELADIPWEYLYIQDARGERTPDSFLALDPRISIVRHEALAVPGDWFAAPGSRRVLVAMSSPPPYERYPLLSDLPAERAALTEMFANVPGLHAEFVPATPTSGVGTVPNATLHDLLRALAVPEPTDVVHFSGHGDFAAEMGETVGSISGEGVLILANQRGQAMKVAANRFAEVLRSKGVRLVVLGACRTGRRDGHNVWSGVVAALLKAGIPAVVAMQYSSFDTLATAFCSTFYRALVTGMTIDAAMALGRTAIRVATAGDMRHTRDWGVPVLYLRAPGGVVFNPVSDTTAQAQAQQELQHLIEQELQVVDETGRVLGAVIEDLQGQTVEIDQRVQQQIAGLVVGATVVDLKNGRLVIRQKAHTVSGVMIGAQIGGKAPSSEAELEQLFLWKPSRDA